MSLQTPGYGTIFETGDKSDGTSSTWTPIAALQDLEPSTEECDDIDTTNMQSANKVRTFQAGLVNPGEVKLVAFYSPSAYAAAKALRGVQKDARITFNDQITTAPSKLVMQGYVKGIGPKTPLNGVDTFEITYKVSGDPVFTAAT
jgi:hypothetical protein